MEITLGSFRCWRIKKLLAFILCMGCSLAVIIVLNSDTLSTVCGIAGLIAYGCITHLPCVRTTCCKACVQDFGDRVCITYMPHGILQGIFFGHRTESVIVKSEIKSVRSSDIRYGGRWLDIIGYRLIVEADKKYVFDSVLLEEGETIEGHGIKELQKALLAQA